MVPKDAQVLARAGFEPRQIRRTEKSGDAEQNGFDFVRLSAQHSAWKPLREDREGDLVLFIAKRSSQFLEECLVGPMQFAQPLQPTSFLLQTKLRCSSEDALDLIFRQITQRRMTTSRARQRKIDPKGGRQGCRIESQLRDITICRRATEESAPASRHENM